MAGRPFVLLGVNTDEDRAQIKRVIQEKGLNWRSWWDGPEGTDGPICRQWSIRSFPTIYLIDHKGVIRGRPQQPQKLDEAIEKLVEEAERERGS